MILWEDDDHPPTDRDAAPDAPAPDASPLPLVIALATRRRLRRLLRYAARGLAEVEFCEHEDELAALLERETGAALALAELRDDADDDGGDGVLSALRARRPSLPVLTYRWAGTRALRTAARGAARGAVVLCGYQDMRAALRGALARAAGAAPPHPNRAITSP